MAKLLNTGANFNNQRATNLASPTNATDGVNKSYVDGLVQGMSWKNPVRAASTANGALATAYANGSTLDGITLATGDRILLKDQTTGSENGIYLVNASGAPTRTSDADTSAELNNATTYVMSGTVNADRRYTQTVDNPTPNSTALVWVLSDPSSGQTLTAGNGIAINSGAITAVPKSGGGIAVDSTGISVDPTIVARKQAYAVPTTGTTVTITHTLTTTDLIVQVFDVSTANSFVQIECDVVVTSTTTVALTFATAPATGQYRAVLVG